MNDGTSIFIGTLVPSGHPLWSDSATAPRGGLDDAVPSGGIPAQAFWSVSLYAVDKDGQFLAANPINRYQISSRTPGLVVNADGSVDIWLQAQRPMDAQAANWLPTPADGRHFTLFARAYEPTGSVLTGTFKMPPVELLP
ncbi:hypothetical protein R69927_02509 [Paraburkholderia domus]|uniref:DUF1214 domain-containing protein n=1 Tax=Paraburkholderia domus TaxID=2793075 RepID=UPI001B169809|nr:DUF1214 domain-containing protein [Paraburkholderia domus]CAE6729540.1 hypothetical protein R75483_02126 [Paraburkholderia domus]CAE6779329.1 hypothetical protein R70006_04320 [Paraburkholderia domus]CAE6859019.1 hypothetical protein R69927_02509 [Paraburkholderia domus]